MLNTNRSNPETSQLAAGKPQPPALLWVLLELVLLACLLVACGSNAGGTDTKTNWLSACNEDADCADGLSCLCGRCNVECEASAECGDLDEDAACFPVDGCSDVTAVCDLQGREMETDAPTQTDDEPSDGTTDGAEETEAATDDTTDSVETGATQTDDATTDSIGTDETDPTDSTGTDETDDPTCDRPIEEYDFLGEECDLVDFDCESAFYDDCGCGCDDMQTDCTPVLEIVATGDDCDTLEIECPSGFTPSYDDCGCGCTPDPEQGCRAADEYVGLGGTCFNISYTCEEGERMFGDDCGCGCEPDPEQSCRPEEEYVAVGAQCQVVRFTCEESEAYFSDECGCGCESGAAVMCSTEGKRYEFDDAASCNVADITCDEGERVFSDACGCGCQELPSPACPAPAGTEVETTVITSLECSSQPAESQVVDTPEDYEALLMACGAFLGGDTPEFAGGRRVYVAFIPERPTVNFLHAVDAGDEIVVGVEAPAYCGGAAPPTSMLTLELEDDSAKPVELDICYTGECGDILPP